MKTSKYLYSLIVFLLLMTIGVKAQNNNKLYIPDARIGVGETALLPVYVQNTSKTITGIQFTINVENGISIDINNAKMTERLTNHKMKVVSKGDQTYSVIVYSSDNAVLTGSDGIVLNLPVSIADTVQIGTTKSIKLSKVVLSDNIGNNVLTESSAGIIKTIKFPQLTLTAAKQELKEGNKILFTITNEDTPSVPLDITISNDMPGRLKHPTSVTMGANSKSATFELEALDNSEVSDTLTASIKVSATGHKDGEYLLMIIDDDMPEIDMELKPSFVSEGAGMSAIVGKIFRKTKTENKITIVLSDDSNGQLYHDKELIMHAGETEVEFTIGIVDNAVINPEYNYTLSAAVYIPSCSCSAKETSIGSISKQITVTDDDGPTLKIQSAKTSINEGSEIDFTVTTNNVSNKDVTVEITSDYDDLFEYNHTVVIPAGQESVHITIKAKENDIVDGNRTVAFFVKADGYATGTCWIQLTDQTLPDVSITNMSVTPSELEVGQKATITITLKNTGSSILPSLTRINLYLGNSKKEFAHFFTPDTLSADKQMVFTEDVEMPNNVGQFTLKAVVNEDRNIKELSYSNNSHPGVQVNILPGFTANAKTDKVKYATGEIVTITGKASGSKATDAEIEIYLIDNKGYRQTISAKTDNEGNYSATYDLSKTESGHFIVGACYPNENLKTEMSSFDVYGLRLSACSNNIELELGDTYQGTMTITNAVNLKQTGLKVTQNDSPENCVFGFTIPEMVEDDEQITLNFTITPSAVSTGRAWQKMPITITSNEGASTDYSINYYINSRLALLTADVSSINTTMTKGAKRDYPITIKNVGKGETGKISLGNLPNWMRTSTPHEMTSLHQGDSATIVLQLIPTDDLALNIPITGAISIVCENASKQLNIPCSITPVSESEGKLIVDVVDEFTFETQEAPHVSNAKIEIKRPTTGELIAQGNSGEDGKFTVTLPEGQYGVTITAENHEEYNNQIIVDAGKDNNHEAFVSYDAVTYSWDVVETEIEDSYEIETIVKYDTRVPKPVILISLPSERPEDGSIIPIVVTNKGFINAEDVNVSLAISGNWNIEFLSEPYLAKLAANQSEVFYAKITSASSSGARSKAAPTLYECLSLQAKLRAHYICGNKYDNTVTANDLRRWGQCLETASNMRYSYGGGGGGYGGYGPGGGGGYGSGWWQIVPIPVKACNPKSNNDNNSDNPNPDLEYYKYDSEKDPFWTPCKREILAGIGNCAGNITGGLISGLVKSLPGVGCAAGIGTSCVLPAVTKRMTGFAFLGCLGSILGCFIPGEQLVQSLIVDGIGCAATAVDVFLSCKNINLFGDDYIKPNSSRAKKALNVVDYNHDDLFDNYMFKLAVAKEESTAFVGYIFEIFGDKSWINATPEEIISLINYLGKFSPEEIVNIDEELLKYKPSNISSEIFVHFIERYNNTTLGYDTNYQNIDNYIHTDKVLDHSGMIDFCESYAVSEGYLSSDEMIQEAYNSFIKYLVSIKADEEQEESKSVCSTITLSFKQEMVMTRQAFRGTLTVNNGDAVNEMKDVKLNLEVKDEDGIVATSHEFQINAESLEGFQGELDLTAGWKLEAKGAGVATILFIPTKYAAPTEPKQWSFGGTFSYTDPTTGLAVTKELYPVTLTVNPSPNLTMDYFMQRDVLGDDALTEDIVEPMVPAEFSLLINNKGYGDATNVKMVTNQPKIIDNEKGLLINFEILSSQLNGGEKTLALGQSVATDFGTIPAGKTSYAQWWFTSSLLGHFTEYDVKATHVTSYGNPDLSLLDTVAVHELIHTLTIPKAETMRGFLVNDEKDSKDLPDMLYMTDGTVKAVAQATATLTDDGNNTYTLTAEPTAAGWNYGNLVDPTNGHKVLSSVTRNSDGTVISLNNFWQTSCTLRDNKDPLYEFRLHFADDMAATGESYTLKFVDKPMTILDIDSIVGASERDGYVVTPVETLTVHFNKDVAASTFTTDDLTLTLAGNKLDTNEIVINKVNETQFELNIKNLTEKNGYYVLTVQTADIKDTEGFPGEIGRKIAWTQLKGGKLTSVLDYDMKKGWNWISSNLEEESKTDTKTFFDPIKNHLLRFVGFDSELTNDPVYGLFGGLETIDPTKGYKLNVKDAVKLNQTGQAADPEMTPMDLQQGWNWIGYLPIAPLSIAEALVQLSPDENDVLKAQDAFATYADGKWTGSLTEMRPGEGYLYFSNSIKSFNYPKVFPSNVASSRKKMEREQLNAPWQYDAYHYADNTTLIGKLFINNIPDDDGDYTIGAFYNNECRGIGRHIDGMVFITIHGSISNAQNITFRAYDRKSGSEFPIIESIEFKGQSVGTLTMPMALHTNGTTRISAVEAGFSISPRPLKSRLYINGTTEEIKTIQIMATNGKKVVDTNGYEYAGIDVSMLLPGLYIVSITTNDGNVYYDKVFKDK